MKPGIIEGLSDTDYFAMQGAVSHSDLKAFARPEKKIAASSSIVGNVFHTALLEPTMMGRYAFVDESPRLNTNVGKARMAELQEQHPGKEIVRPQEAEKARGLVRAVRECPTAMKIIEADGRQELTVLAQLEDFDCMSRCRMDIERKGKLVADLKHTFYSDEDSFRTAILSYGYDSQGAYYADTYQKATGDRLPFFWICASYSSGLAWVVRLPEYAEHSGRRWYRDVLGIAQRAGIFSHSPSNV